MVQRYEFFSSVVEGICRSIQKIEADEMEKYGLRGSYAQYLEIMLQRKEKLTLSQLSELCMKDKAAVSRAISEMERKGLVVRESANDNMYRASLVLTELGEEAARYVVKKVKTAVELAGKGITDEERKVFYASLDLIASNLKDISRQGLPEE